MGKQWTFYRTGEGDPVVYDGREAWLKGRAKRIGGSDAAAILGMSPYMTNEQLWEIKTGRREQPDISEKDVVQYGTQAEDHLRELFKLDFPDYYVGYTPYNLFLNPKFPWAHASLDGWLNKDGRMGILEIKTSLVSGALQAEKWRDRIPDMYYCQVLHYLMVTGWDFVILKAQLKYQYDDELPYLQTRHYYIDRADVEQDIAVLEKAEMEFWRHVQENKRPAVILPEI